MRHCLEPIHHAGNGSAPGVIDRAPVGLHDSDRIEEVLDEPCVVHGCCARSGRVGQNLLADFGAHQLQAPPLPALRFAALEEHAGVDERLRIREDVVALQVRFDAAASAARLNRQALPHFGVGELPAIGHLIQFTMRRDRG